MKKLIIVFLISVIAVSCNDGKKEDEKMRYSQDSEEINTLKAAISDYENGNWDAMKKHYADTAQIFHNSNSGKNINEIIQGHEQDLTDLQTYGFVDEEDEYEMVLTDDGNTWVNFWGDWKATISGVDKEVTIPIHLTAQFENGKIVREHGYWDNAIMMAVMQEMDSSMTSQDSIQSPGN
ncbi:nuclear transport factor 2 family protein [Christiangramia echinicola]|uniref:nuclear transport factor 2 family protein n=1 Tax=Christiangramia echinicola TaxID=279359 RepID=UPI0003F914FB|nr:nuclear transport factor 2 family protein [Christiangramia echinicola]